MRILLKLLLNIAIITLLCGLAISCVCGIMDSSFRIKVTNSSDQELIVYIGVFPPHREESPFIQYYRIGTIPPGKSASQSFLGTKSAYIPFKLIAERNIGQPVHFNATVLPSSSLDSEAVYYVRTYDRETWEKVRGNHIPIPKQTE